MPATLIAHITDPHTTSLKDVSFARLFSKRALGYISWRRKRQFRHTQAMLEAATAAALTHRPDAFVITGDLLHVGLAEEMRQIRPWLHALADQTPVMLVPGNHDLYSPDSQNAWQEEFGDLPIFGEALSPEHPWPRVLRINHVQVIGLASAYPAPLTRADGKLGDTQCSILEQTLATQASDGTVARAATLLALHHPAEPTLSALRKSLLDAPRLQQLIKSNSVTGLVHGHLHENISYRVGTTPCFCTASASSTYSKAPASFRLLEFSESGDMRSRLYEAGQPTTAQEVPDEALFRHRAES